MLLRPGWGDGRREHAPGRADTAANPDPRGAYIEVRTCYRFTTLLPINDFLPIGEVFLQKESVFTVADY